MDLDKNNWMYQLKADMKFSHKDIYYFSLVFLAVSLPLSIFTTSLAEIILFINWIWEGNFRQKIES